ncbi:glutathione S-transferase family protein [uncultured Sphingomonas sp.]|uniref:glutathione S-transferase family protein n=1 Tax=uncultured Sphingomonas sp. TaxID=158754 RepID=UPI0035CA69A4
MAEIKFWFSPGACSLAPHVLLHEIGVAFEAVTTNVFDGAQLTAAFARINPKQRVPVLALDGQVITEVPAIATAIADLAPERHLMGRTPLDRAKIYEWMSWLSGTLHGQGFGALWRPERFSDDPDVFDSIRAKGRTIIADCFDAIEGKLSGPYSTGSAFTAADPYLLVFYRWGNGIGFDLPATHPHYTDFARALVQRASVAAAMIAEGIADQALTDDPATRSTQGSIS